MGVPGFFNRHFATKFCHVAGLPLLGGTSFSYRRQNVKKILLLLCGLAVTSSAAFAQFTISGGAYTGVGVVVQDDNWEGLSDEPAPYYVMSSQTHAAYRIFLYGDYANVDKNMGFSLAFQASPGGNPIYNLPQDPLFVPFTSAFGWVKLFDNVLTLRGGYNVANRDFDFGRDGYMIARSGSDEGSSLTIEPGLAVLVTPFDGFSFGGSFKPKTFDFSDASATGRIAQSRTAEYQAGVTYTIPRFVTLTATFLRDDRPSATDINSRMGGEGGITTLTAGFQSAGIPNLNFSVAAKLDKLHNFENGGTVLFMDYINYTMGNLQIGFDTNQQILLAETITGRETFDAEPFSFLVQPYVAYSFGRVTPRLDVAYIHNGRIYDHTLWTYDIGTLTNVKGDYAFVAQPSVSWRPPAGGFTLSAGYKFGYYVSDQAPANDRMLSIFYLDLEYRFLTVLGGGADGGGGRGGNR
jgi:hypothetical protein